MKYLEKEGFSSRPLSEEGQDTWERVFGKGNRLCISEKCIDPSSEKCSLPNFKD